MKKYRVHNKRDTAIKKYYIHSKTKVIVTRKPVTYGLSKSDLAFITASYLSSLGQSNTIKSITSKLFLDNAKQHIEDYGIISVINRDPKNISLDSEDALKLLNEAREQLDSIFNRRKFNIEMIYYVSASDLEKAVICEKLAYLNFKSKPKTTQKEIMDLYLSNIEQNGYLGDNRLDTSEAFHGLEEDDKEQMKVMAKDLVKTSFPKLYS